MAAPRPRAPGPHRRGPANAGPSRRNSPARRVRRTAAIMAEILTRTGDYGCPAAEVRVPGAPPRHARVLYLCSAAARPTVIRARDALPGALAARVEIRGLPAGAGLTAGPSPAARPASSRSGGPSPARASPASSSPPALPGPPRPMTAPPPLPRPVTARRRHDPALPGVPDAPWLVEDHLVAAAGDGFRCGNDSGGARRPGRGLLGQPWRGSSAGRRASCTGRRPGACRCSRRGWPRWPRTASPGRGWPPHRTSPGWPRGTRPRRAATSKAAVTVAPVAIPLGLVAGGLAWSWRIYTMETGSGGLAPSAPAAFDQRQWRHQVRTARARIAAPGSVPLLLRDGSVVAGATIRAVRHPARPLAVLPYPRLRSHQVVLGTTGTGKTTLLLRLWAGFMTRGCNCTRRAGRRARCSSCWTARAGPIPAGSPTGPAGCCAARAPRPPRSGPTRPACRCGRCRPGSSSAPWWTWSSRAPAAPPTTPTCWKRSSGWRWRPRAGRRASTADFLARLDANWLALAYAGAPDSGSAGLLRSSAGHVSDVALRYRALLRRLGAGLDGPGGFGDADAWYCILEGTAEIARGRGAGPRAGRPAGLVRGRRFRGRRVPRRPAPRQRVPPGRARRDILLAVDEFSAVSRRLPIWQLYERARSLGLAVQVSAQSWPGLAADEDERYRVATTADGGIWLLRTPHPEPVAALAGARRVVDTARRLLGVPLWATGVGTRGTVPGRGHAGGGPRDHPRAGRRPGRLHLPRRGDLRAGETAGGRACRADAARLPGAAPGPAPRPAGRARRDPGGRRSRRPAGEPGAARPAELGALLDEAFGEES